MDFVTPTEIARFRERFPVLNGMGLLSDDYAIAVIGADKLHCRPCDIRSETPLDDGTVPVYRA